MATKMFEVQQGIYQQLLNNNNFIKKITGFYDFVPEKTKLPYATFGKINSRPIGSKVSTGEAISVSIDIWSEAKGKKEVVDILAALETALEDEVTLNSAQLISQKIINREVWEESYGLFTGQIDIEIQIMEEL